MFTDWATDKFYILLHRQQWNIGERKTEENGRLSVPRADDKEEKGANDIHRAANIWTGETVRTEKISFVSRESWNGNTIKCYRNTGNNLYICIQTIIHEDFLNFYIKLCAPLHIILKNILSFKNPTSLVRNIFKVFSNIYIFYALVFVFLCIYIKFEIVQQLDIALYVFTLVIIVMKMIKRILITIFIFMHVN